MVDDDASIRNYFSQALEAERWNSVAVESGELALERLAQQQFALVFLDLVMIGMNGTATFRGIREIDTQVNVAICTSLAESVLTQQVLDIGPVTLIRRPIRLDQSNALHCHRRPTP